MGRWEITLDCIVFNSTVNTNEEQVNYFILYVMKLKALIIPPRFVKLTRKP